MSNDNSFEEKTGDSLAHALGARSRARKRELRQASDLRTGPQILPRNDLLPNLSIESRLLADLRPTARRVRKSDPAHVARIRDTIAALGFCNPIHMSDVSTCETEHAA